MVDLLRPLGHVKLCGLLYIAYQRQSDQEAQGQYMLCALFGAHLLLAAPERGLKTFRIQAVVDAMHFRLESSEDGQGLPSAYRF